MTLATDNLPFPWFTHCQSTLILVFECGLVRKKPLVSKAFPRSVLRGVTAGFWEIFYSRSWECKFPSSPWLFHTHTKGFLCGESPPGPSAFLRVTKPRCSPPELCWILCPLPSHPCVGSSWKIDVTLSALSLQRRQLGFSVAMCCTENSVQY